MGTNEMPDARNAEIERIRASLADDPERQAAYDKWRRDVNPPYPMDYPNPDPAKQPTRFV